MPRRGPPSEIEPAFTYTRAYLRDPDPPATLDLVGVLDPGVGVVNLLPPVAVSVDPFGKLGKRVPSLHMVGETPVRELQPLAGSDEVGILANHPAVGQPYAPPPALCRTTVPPEGDLRERVPFLDVVPLEPI